MGAILGSVAGWERTAEWAPENRIYEGPAYIKYEIPPERIPPEKRFEYRVTLDITIYLCDTPDLFSPLIIRKIDGIKIIAIFEEEYLGGLEQWVSDVSIREAEELSSRSNIEVAGLRPCEKPYDIRTYDKEEIRPPVVVPPVPKYILEEIAYLEERYKEAETIDEKLAIREEIDRIKQRYGIS